MNAEGLVSLSVLQAPAVVFLLYCLEVNGFASADLWKIQNS